MVEIALVPHMPQDAREVTPHPLRIEFTLIMHFQPEMVQARSLGRWLAVLSYN
jgi:hypothetical protein